MEAPSDDRRPRRTAMLAVVAVLLLAGTAALIVALSDDDGGGDDGSGGARTSDRIVVWAVGDGADGSERSKRLAERIAKDEVDRFLYLGDVYETGTAEEFDERYDLVYGRFAKITEPTPGNHDWPRHEEGYDPYWSEVKGRPQPPYYDFRLGGWQLLSLNSETENGSESPQIRWLEERVEGSGTCRIAFWHRARFSAGSNHGDETDVDPTWDTLRDKASIVLTAHDHTLQRFPEIEGITQFVVGTGGHDPHQLDPKDDRPAFATDDEQGALRLELEPGRARFAFVDVEGRTLDSGTVPCERV